MVVAAESAGFGFAAQGGLNVSVGQGDTRVSPLQMAMAYAAIANGGDLFYPRLVDRIENDEGAWSGQCDLLVIADGGPDPFACLFSGEGAYDGLSAYLVFENPEQPPNPFKGLIF